MELHGTPSRDFELPTPSASVIFKPLDDGGVLLSTADEVYFGVNGVGARIWSLLPPVTRTFAEMCTLLAREYPDVDIERIRRDALDFVNDVVGAGLATAAPGGASIASTGPSSAPSESS